MGKRGGRILAQARSRSEHRPGRVLTRSQGGTPIRGVLFLAAFPVLGAFPALGASLVVASLALSGCGRPHEVDPAKARSRILHSLQECLEDRGGQKAVERFRNYRAEGVITLVPERRVAEYVRWVDASGRMRVELREKARGEIRIVSSAGTWAGPDDRSLVFGSTSLADHLTLALARRDFPAPFLANLDSLEFAPPDKKKRLVLRAHSVTGILVDHHLSNKRHRLETVSAVALEEPDYSLRVELGAYRKVQGARFPFKETLYRGKEKLAEIRFREVEPLPAIAEPVFVPRVAPTQ